MRSINIIILYRYNYMKPRGIKSKQPRQRRAGWKSRPSSNINRDGVRVTKQLGSLVSSKGRFGPKIGYANGVQSAWQDTTLKLLTNTTITSTSGVVNNAYFWANSLYAPFNSSTSEQPYTFDQLAGLYETYIVKYFRYKITFLATSNVPMVVGATFTNDTYTASSYTVSDIIERGICKGYKIASNSTDKPTVIRSKWYGMGRVQGLSETEYMLDKLLNAALVNTSPSNKVVLNIFAGSFDETSTGTVRLLIETEYKARFLDPKFLADS